MNTSTGRTNNKTDRLRIKLLPQLAWKGIVSNGSVYYPYLAAGIFSVFTYFVFASILHNDIVKLVPKSAYMWIADGTGTFIDHTCMFSDLCQRFFDQKAQKGIRAVSYSGIGEKAYRSHDAF